MSDQVVLVTGASSGIGFQTAIDLKNKGYIVYGAARREDKLKPLEEYGIKILPLDVTNEESMVNCVDSINKESGGVDILVNNAGYGSYGAVEDVQISEAKNQLEVNLFGLARMVQLVLPHMREKNKGKIINISSIAGKTHTPFGAWYHAAKFAVEGFSDCLRIEVKDFNIDVIIIEPGAIKTDWGIIAGNHLIDSSSTGAYKEKATTIGNALIHLYSKDKGISPASIISDTIVKAVLSNKPRTRYLIGKNAKPMLIARRLLSDRAYDRMVYRIMSKF